MLFAHLSLILIAANYDTAIRIWAVWKVTRSAALLVNEVVTSLVALVLLVTPWILGWA